MSINPLTLGSLFDGSGGFPLAGMLAGITPLWASEIEPFAIRVTTARIPQMKHYGDISALHGDQLPPVDIITFGSPCQDMSICGLRAGLDGSRSSLFYEAIRIIKEMRLATNGEKPRWICWENVPGAFSSSDGRDFKAVLEAVIGVKEPGITVPSPDKNQWPYADCYLGDGWSVAYRVLDAQYWGVPQRRARIFLVADFGSERAPEILFKSEGLYGHPPQGGVPWESAAGDSSECAGTTSRPDEQRVTEAVALDGYNSTVSDKAATLGINCGMSTGRNGIVLNDQGGKVMEVTENVVSALRAEAHNHLPIVVENQPTDCRVRLTEDAVFQTLTARCGTGGNNVPLVMEQPEAEAFNISSLHSRGMQSDNPNVGFSRTGISRTLDTNGGNPNSNQGGIAIVAFTQNQRNEVRDLHGKAGALAAYQGAKQQTYVIQGSMIGRADSNGPQGCGINEDVSFTLNTIDHHAVAFTPDCEIHEEITGTITRKDSLNFHTQCVMTTDSDDPFYIVRRLIPRECARLQGFPAWWCSDLGVENPTQEEISFWAEVFETHRKIMGTSSKPKSEKQLIKWLRDPHSDAAEYKLWGNGVALPCVYFVLSGIVWAANQG